MGVLGNFRESVTLVNRTNRNLNVRYDGEDITLPPGDNPNFPRVAVPYAKKQNPLMGSKHPNDPRKFISLVGVRARVGEKQRDAIDPIAIEVLAEADTKLEVLDRSGQWHNEPMREVKLLKKTPYSAYEAQCAINPEFSAGKNIE